MRENYKVYKLSSKDDFIVYLRYLIQLAHRQMYYLKKYVKSLENEIDCHKEMQYVSGDIYENHRNRIAFLTIYITNLFGDDASQSMSYRKFRRCLDKSPYNIGPLSKEIVDILTDLNVGRNWAAHIPESFLHAEFEASKKYNKNITMDRIIQYPSPIIINIYQKYNLDWLVNLLSDLHENYQIFQKVLQQMKKDFSRLINTSVEVVTNHITENRSTEYDNEIPSISYQMQRKLYKSNS
jgi:hypothetical protein